MVLQLDFCVHACACFKERERGMETMFVDEYWPLLATVIFQNLKYIFP